MYNALNLAVAKIANKNGIRDAVKSLWFYPDRTMATDSYRLIEVMAPQGAGPAGFEKPFAILAEESKAIKPGKDDKVIVGAVSEDEASFATCLGVTKLKPAKAEEIKYEQIWPTGAPKATVRVNPRYLRDIAEIMAKANGKGIDIAIYGETRPLTFTANGGQQARAMLMPIRP